VTGARGEGTDVVTNAQFVLPPAGVLTGFVDSVVTAPLDPAIVQQWVNSPTNNHGIKLQVEGIGSPVFYVQAQRAVSASRPVTHHPRLTISYLLPPPLKIRQDAVDQVRISWATNAAGFILTAASNLTGSYLNPGLTVTNEGIESVVYDSIQTGPRFYRLKWEP
jgi:hypothetical protein